MAKRFRSPVLVAVVFECGLGLVALALHTLGGSLGPWSAASDGAGHARAILIGIAATLPLLALLLVLDRYPRGPFRELSELTDRLLVPLFRDASLAQLALVSLAAGLGEELLFRGFVQSTLAAQGNIPGDEWLAVGFAALLFGLCHALTRTYALVAGGVGFYLGGLLVITDNMLAPVTTHGLYDFLALVYLVHVAARREGPRDVERNEAEPDDIERDDLEDSSPEDAAGI